MATSRVHRLPAALPGTSTEVPTVSEYLADPQARAAIDETTARVADNLAIIVRETGLTEEEIVRIPVLFKIELVAQPGDSPPAEHYGGLLPNAINGLLYDPTTVVFPRQFGPRVDGVDVMERAVERAYGRAGLDARSIDTSLTYHPAGGEIHCGTNTFRDVSAPWWR